MEDGKIKNVSSQDLYLTTPQIICKNGYPCEVHKVTTDDGYILTLHRIPHSHDPSTPQSRPVALLVPGAFCSSAIWVMGLPENALAFRLADQGYDVFLGNHRGTTYSKEHVTFDIESKEYWNFSWNEIARLDIPATFDYILNLTGQPDLFYLGHSMGTTVFFVSMSLRPEYNSKVRLMSALAPVAFMDNMISPIPILLAPFLRYLNWLSHLLSIYQLFPHNFIWKILGVIVGHPFSPLQSILPSILFLICGDNPQLLNKNILPVILGHVPAGISAKCLKHYAQGINSGEFRQYNYGRHKNELMYGQSTPPHYDLSKVTAPVALYYSSNDWLAAKTDVHRLANLLPNVVKKYLVPFDKFSHCDFLWATKAPSLLFEIIEKEMAARVLN